MGWKKLNLLKNLVIIFLNLAYSKHFYYLIYLTNLMFGKNLVPELWIKMLLTKHTAYYLNQLYHSNEMMK